MATSQLKVALERSGEAPRSGQLNEPSFLLSLSLPYRFNAHRFCLSSGPEGNFGAGGGGFAIFSLGDSGFAILSFGGGTGFCTVTGFGGVNTFEGVCTLGFDCVGSFSQPRSVRTSPSWQGAGAVMVGVGVFVGVCVIGGVGPLVPSGGVKPGWSGATCCCTGPCNCTPVLLSDCACVRVAGVTQTWSLGMAWRQT
jgi:hypothetical protein